jgi:hypothetical protein
MTHPTVARILVVGSTISLLTTGCAEAPSGVGDDTEATSLLSVSPQGGATNVDPNTTVTIQFSHAMHMEMYVALHEGSMSGQFGPIVPGSWSWSHDGTHMTFQPDSGLKHGTQYTVHIGGGMMDANGNTINLEQHGHQMGGQWVSGQMMQGCMMCSGMMGHGWQHHNGTYGMGFTFTTR